MWQIWKLEKIFSISLLGLFSLGPPSCAIIYNVKFSRTGLIDLYCLVLLNRCSGYKERQLKFVLHHEKAKDATYLWFSIINWLLTVSIYDQFVASFSFLVYSNEVIIHRFLTCWEDMKFLWFIYNKRWES